MNSITFKSTGALLAVFFILTYISSCSFSTKARLELLNESRKKGYDVIIVPGIPFDTNRWDSIMKDRVYWSKYLYDTGIAKNIIYSGSSVYSPYYEAEIMALYGEALGIPKEHIFIETKAEHSTQNAYYSYKLAKKLGFTRIALASDPFQTKRLKKFVQKKLNPDVGLIPFVEDSLRIFESGKIDPVIDYKQAYNKSFISIKKRDSFFKRLKGTMGLTLDTNAYK